MSSCFYLEDLDFDSEIEDPEINLDVEREMLLLATCFSVEIKEIALQYIKSFFKNKSFSQGGKIPSMTLFSSGNVSMVINYDIIESVKCAYGSLEKHNVPNAMSDSYDIELVVSILNELAEFGIPQQFAGGMMLLYLKLVEGIEIVQ